MGSSDREGGAGSADGIGAAARFNTPWGVATDAAANIYVAERSNKTIRKISPAGVVTTLAGVAGQEGVSDGTGAEARFSSPLGMAADSAGNLYVADVTNQTIRKITSAGVVTTLAGTAGQVGSADGIGAAARFLSPAGVATDGVGNVYVAEYDNHTVRKITPAGVVTTLAGTAGLAGSADGTGAAARFLQPHGVATDGAGNVYVAEIGNHIIRKITPAGVVSTLAGAAGQAGSADATGPDARFASPVELAVDSAGNVLVADLGNKTIRRISPAGVVTTLAGRAGIPGIQDAATGGLARFNAPTGAALDSAGNLYVTDATAHSLRKVTPAGVVTTVAGPPQYGSADGTGALARFNSPRGAAIDSTGNIYVPDANNHTIRRITPAGVVGTFAGTAGEPGSVDATGAAARFNGPAGMAADAAGNLYVADALNLTIRKITPTGVVSTFAGAPGQSGRTDGTGAAARFQETRGIATDNAGNVYVADFGAIRKITPAGAVTTLAGVVGLNGSIDAVGAAARFSAPLTGVATDGAGNVYVADLSNHTIRKITPAGVVTTLAGTAGQSGTADATGAAARFFFPAAVAVDSGGNVYVADLGNHTVRRITPNGAVTTVVGGPAEPPVFEPGALPGRLSSPLGVAVSGNLLYISALDGIALVTPLP